jgi:hypothetical protein
MKSTEEIVYDEAVRAIDQQPRIIDELRSRTSILLAAAALTAGVIASAGSRADAIGGIGDAAIAILAVAVALCVAVLIPRKHVTFVLSPQILLEDHVDVLERNSPEKLYRFLALTLEHHYDANDVKIRHLYRLFRWACIAISLDVALWLVDLAS